MSINDEHPVYTIAAWELAMNAESTPVAMSYYQWVAWALSLETLTRLVDLPPACIRQLPDATLTH